MNFTRPFLLGPAFFRTAVLCSGGYHLERGGVPLHDAVGIYCAVGINCKKGATTENKCADVRYVGLGVYVDDFVKSWYIKHLKNYRYFPNRKQSGNFFMITFWC